MTASPIHSRRSPLRHVRGWQVAAICYTRVGGRRGASRELVDELSPAMLRMARIHVRTQEAAEDVVQEAWIAVIKGLDRFEGRSKLSTWIFGIVINIARAHGRARSPQHAVLDLRRRARALQPGRSPALAGPLGDRAVRRTRAGLKDPKRPGGSFIFAGPRVSARPS